MRKFKLILAILGLLLSFVTMAVDNSFTRADGSPALTGETFTARVISPKAVVYADENMLSPLGYIANGKGVRVGNPRRMNRDLVPLVVYGRLAFIEIKDIRYEESSEDEYKFKRGAPLEHNFDATMERPEEKMSQNNSFYFSLHRYTGGSEVQNLFTTLVNAQEDSFIGFEALFVHRQPTGRAFWGLGIDYSLASSSGMKFSYWLFSPSLGYTIVKSKLYNLDLYATLDLALNMGITIDGSDFIEPKGFIWGPQFNARMVFFPQEKFHPFAGLGIRKYMVSGYEDYAFKSVSGINAFVGLAMEFR